MKKLRGILSAVLVIGMISTTNVHAAGSSGWQKEGKHTYYYVEGMKVKGLYAVKNRYYYFGKDGFMKTGKQKVKGTTYYLNDQGVMQMRKTDGVYYNSHNQPIDPMDGYEYETIEKAKAIVKKITTKKMSRSQKLLKCFKWVQHFNYKKPRKFSYKKGWTAVYANDHFNGGDGDCHSDASAFAYLAYVLGYKHVYVCSDDDKLVHGNAHSFAEVEGKVYDTLFAEAKSFKKNYGVSYKVYIDGKRCQQKVPYATMKAIKTKKKLKAKRHTYWNSKDQKLYLANGKAATGINAYKNTFYVFDDQGNYNDALTKQLRKVAKYKAPINSLKALLGDPISTSYAPSCLGTGQDGLWTYKNFTVATYKDEAGQEFYMGVNKI
ncbi:MAG: hypothetical protein PUF83_07480 [Intestinibaculum porci]|uniref:hypothetical protein n=1 Tax=Intestinibaculum porci TaxID=2487118 RepID=UPI000ED68DE3|nr:hypothetical protein [Intestinibaculum porci]MDD6422884.1 hypothetical protein [Intestinibaculum porci]HAN57700.1 hypothetical protein [Erysipelotrichaceae bacterium]